ncbi:hypothetical protein ColLi_00740 [Colletotrichum liriopes]|uniref:N-acetyltransferase domain-containing protein n=1 Tax=Colletotrichum liriopes TaxID=708192 RepID=A0AA37GC13_9PEZI|nr:hypothetical protein ColLi_00740 [Colletotrichum liriopes]
MATGFTNRVKLIPWDARSDGHVRRMYDQRVACGWRADEVREWKDRQLKGTKFMWWIALVRDEYSDELLGNHLVRYPDEKTPLKDTVDAVRTTRRLPTLQDFVPVGHISLETKPEVDSVLKLPENGVFWVTSLYISWAIQEGGVGRSAMRHLENLAVGNSFQARILALDTPSKEFQLSPEFIKTSYTDRGWKVPKVLRSTQEWYERQGYVVFHRDDEGYPWTHPTSGQVHKLPLVFMKKDV